MALRLHLASCSPRGTSHYHAEVHTLHSLGLDYRDFFLPPPCPAAAVVAGTGEALVGMVGGAEVVALGGGLLEEPDPAPVPGTASCLSFSIGIDPK